MKILLVIIALGLSVAPAMAQLHERGMMRTGAVLRSQPGGDAFMCRLACSLESGCAGWSWTRAGETGPQARCDLLSAVTDISAAPCCDSGLGAASGAPAAAMTAPAPAPEGDRYATRARQPDGSPVMLTGDPDGGDARNELGDLWNADEPANDETQTAETGEGAGIGPSVGAPPAPSGPFAASVSSVATAQDAPSARIVAGGANMRRDEGPRYSVQQEYAPAMMAAPPSITAPPTTPHTAPMAPMAPVMIPGQTPEAAQQAPQGMADPGRRTGF